MAVSLGFYKKICQWIIDENSGEIAFRPFQVDGNPYKSNVFIVGVSPEQITKSDTFDIKIYVDSLVKNNLFEDTNELYKYGSREYKGMLNFVNWMKEQYTENVVITNVNSYLAESTQELKRMKRANDPLYIKGLLLFEEVVNEFVPNIIIIQGSKAFNDFLESFGHLLINKLSSIETDSVQQLEQQGVIAELPLLNGKNAKILVCRSMMYFGKEGASFGQFKETLENLLTS